MKFKMNSLIFKIPILLSFCLLLNSAWAEGPYFGYWANFEIDNNANHTNITHVWNKFANITTATNHIVNQLDLADQYGISAIVSLDTYLFTPSSIVNGEMQCDYSANSNAATNFANLVSTLVSEGHLVPGDPSASTIAAFIPVDEPSHCGLADQGQQAHPALEAAVNVIRNNSSTSNFPVYINVAKEYATVDYGMRLADWVSMDNYGFSTNSYINDFNQMMGMLDPGQKTLLLPQAALGGIVDSSYHYPRAIFEKMKNDNRVIGIIPFLWSHSQTTGTKDIPSLRADWENFGGQIKAGDLINPYIACSPNGITWESWTCSVTATGGTTPYTYAWSDNYSTWDSATYGLDCSGAGETKLVSVQVTDTNGYYDYSSEWITCGEIQ